MRTAGVQPPQSVEAMQVTPSLLHTMLASASAGML